MSRTPLRILLADDHNLFVEGLSSLLGSVKGFSVCGIVRNGIELIEEFPLCQPDVALVDLNMPKLNGMDATKAILTSDPEAKIIILSMYDDPELVQQMEQVGASGYLVKGCDFNVLVSAVEKVARGQKAFTTRASNFETADFYDDFLSRRKITPREAQVLKLISNGLTNDEIASQLRLSPLTVLTHRKNLMQKIEARNIAELVSKSLREGLI